MVSSEITDDSVLLYRRGLRERLAAIAPFLRFDSDPYAVVDGERVVWVVDGYTTSSTYPYSQFLPAGVSVGTPATSDVNYVRASVRATVDAVDGTVHLYRTDDGDDPIISVWDEVLPGLFESSDDLPLGVATHLRYPTDLFLVQSAMLARYHVSAVEDLFSGVDRWTISPAAATTVADENRGPAPVVDLFVDAEFSATRTYGPGAADNPGATRDALAGVAIAPHRAQGSPRLLVPRLLVPRDDVLLSPQVAQSAIDADPRLAQDITLLNANGSHVDFGPMSPLLIGDGMVWARSITVTGTGPASVPRLYGIAVISDGLVGLGPTLDDAIDSIGHSAAE